jgi:hypothetical protein
LALGGSTEQAAQPPAARAEHHILEAEPDSDVGTDIAGVMESRQLSAAPITATAAILALMTGDRGIRYPNKRFADDAFAEGEDQPATAAVAYSTKGHTSCHFISGPAFEYTLTFVVSCTIRL